MTPAILLDTGPLGVLSKTSATPPVRAAKQWLAGLKRAGRRVIVPEISDYELRRQLLLNGSVKGISNLDWLIGQLEYLPLATPAMRRAAELWADARRQGLPTAPPGALDGDAILAAQALTLGGPAVVATTNVSHLARFAAAEFWLHVAP